MKKVNIDSESCVIKPEIYKKYGKNVLVEFDKCFNTDKQDLNLFIITRTAYSKNLEEICRYSNTFFKYYDHDKEFLTGLLNIKYQIDKNIYTGIKQFICDIAEYLFTDSVINKIFKMVDDYYEVDLSPTDEVKNIDLHALQFMNEHGKSLLALAIAYKLTIPLVCHFYVIYFDKLSAASSSKKNVPITIKNYLYDVFLSYFPLFQKDSLLFNKLAVTVKSHLTYTKTSDKILWSRMANKKITPTTCIDKLIAVIVVDLIPKSIFKKNLIFLFQVSIPQQIKNMLLGKDTFEYCEISTKSSGDELSGLEKMEANSAQVSDLNIIISSVNIKKSIKKICKKFNIILDPDEISWYKENIRSFTFSDIILQFFSKYFGGYYDLKSISKSQYIKLLIIFKKIMSDLGFFYIPQLLTGNISKTIKRRNISNKQLKHIEESYKFKELMKNYSCVITEDNNPILNNIAMLINTPIEYVDYSNRSMLGKDIKVDIGIVVDEYIRFLYMI